MVLPAFVCCQVSGRCRWVMQRRGAGGGGGGGGGGSRGLYVDVVCWWVVGGCLSVQAPGWDWEAGRPGAADTRGIIDFQLWGQ